MQHSNETCQQLAERYEQSKHSNIYVHVIKTSVMCKIINIWLTANTIMKTTIWYFLPTLWAPLKGARKERKGEGVDGGWKTREWGMRNYLWFLIIFFFFEEKKKKGKGREKKTHEGKERTEWKCSKLFFIFFLGGGKTFKQPPLRWSRATETAEK